MPADSAVDESLETSTFAELLAAITPSAESIVHLTPDWGQGRATYGGAVGGLMLRSMELQVERDRPLRSLLVSFVGPAAPGKVKVKSQVLRSGKSVTQVECRMTQPGDDGEAVCATAVASFGAGRASEVHVAPPPRPEAPPPESCQSAPFVPGVMPTFLRHFDMRWTRGNVPFSGAAEPDFAGWCRFREVPRDAGGDAWMIGLLDVWPAGVLPMLRRLSPASSLTWAVDVVTADVDSRPDEFWFYDVNTVGADNGFTQADARLWRPDGQLAVVSRQTSAIFG